MDKPVFRVVGLDHATCDEAYCGSEAVTRSDSVRSHGHAPDRSVCNQSVTIRLGDILPVLQQSAMTRLAWINDFAEDPVVISRDLYEVLLTYQRLKRTA